MPFADLKELQTMLSAMDANQTYVFRAVDAAAAAAAATGTPIRHGSGQLGRCGGGISEKKGLERVQQQ